MGSNSRSGVRLEVLEVTSEQATYIEWQDLISVKRLLEPGAVVPERLQDDLSLLCTILAGEGLPPTAAGFDQLESTLMCCYSQALGNPWRMFGTFHYRLDGKNGL